MEWGVYINAGSDTEFSGVEKKIDNQINCFSKEYEMKHIVIKKEKTNPIKSILWRLPLGSFGRNYEQALNEINKLKSLHFIYIRSLLWDRRAYHFIRGLRLMFPDARILLELPTYPYASELIRSKTMWPFFFKDLIYRNSAMKSIDRIVTYSDDDYIYGIPTIKTMNGVDVESIKMGIYRGDECDISIIAVAMMQPYHGYERLIKGLYEYYRGGGKLDFHIHFVGYGNELPFYIALTEKYKLTDHIFFEGKLEGDDLDLMYEKCDLAAGSMGGYKIGINSFSSLKLGEYLAKGLPVITGAKTTVFSKYGDEYNLDFPNDSTSIDFNRIAEFHDRVYNGHNIEDVREKIREFALNSIDIKCLFQVVIEYLKEE